MRGARISQNWNTSGYWNVTAEIMRVLHVPKVSLGQIESLVFSAAILLIFLESFGAYRKHSSNKLFRVIAWTAYTIPPSLINYTQGLMQAVSYKNELFIIWATFLIMLLGSADSMTAYARRDNEQWKTHSWQLLIKMTGLGLLVLMYADASTLLTALEVLYCVAIVKVTERACASRLASRAVLQRNTKWIVDYTKRDSVKSIQDRDDEVDLSTMKGYTYMVDTVTKWGGYIPLLKGFFKRNFVEKANAPDYHVRFEVKPEDITVYKVWQCQGKLLREGDSNHRFKDLCLSFALFRILSARYAGYTMPRDVHHKLWKLFQKIIKSEEEKGAERAFRIIEVELALLFYQVYTKCQIMFQFWVLKGIKLGLMIVGSCIVASNIMHHIHNPRTEEYVQLATSNGLNIDVLLTAMIIITVLLLEITSLVYFSCFTEWGKVSWICSYVYYDSWQIKNEEDKTWMNRLMETLIGIICRLPTRPRWEKTLRQYSLLESYTYHPQRLIYNCVTTLFFDQEREGRKESDSMELRTEVKSAVIDFISSLDRNKWENGISPLDQSRMPELSRAWDFKTHAQVIMVWHIATAMCEYKIPVKSNTGYQKDFNIATGLSKYLAYLVAFVPRLLPDHPYVTDYVLDQVIIEARETFRHCGNDLGDRVRELLDVRSREKGETVIDSGARLGKHLLGEVKDPENIWKVLADFWVHRMAYVAPSKDITAHVEHLPMGGEFVTHIWALLTHCGIKRKSSKEEPKLDRWRRD